MATIFAFLAVFAVLTTVTCKPETLVFPNLINTDPNKGQFTNQADTPFSYPRISPLPNDTSFETWYFSAVNAKNINESVTVAFHLATNTSLPGRASNLSAVSIEMTMSFADGRVISILDDADRGDVGSAKFYYNDSTSIITGDWLSNGFTFQTATEAVGPPLYSTGVVVINNDLLYTTGGQSIAMNGWLSFDRLVPPRLPCSTSVNHVGETFEIMPFMGMANEMPDGIVNANLQVVFGSNDVKRMTFRTGLGYFDQKWSLKPFHLSVRDWFFGHARVGEYSLVWFQSTDRNGKIYSNAYIAQQGPERASADCEKDFWEPKLIKIGNYAERTELTITMNNPDDQLSTFRFTVEKMKEIVRQDALIRWTGTITGGIEGGAQFNGSAIFEEYHF